MNKFVPIGMRTHVDDPQAIVVNTCSGNDTAEAGDQTRWTWANPTNRAIVHKYAGIEAVSVECLWQGTKITAGMMQPNIPVLCGNWRLGKGKRPIGAWAGEGMPLITSPGAARRAIYLPAFERQIRHWLANEVVLEMLGRIVRDSGLVYMRDHDTGQGVDRNGPMSHAWLLATWFNQNMFGDIIRTA